MLPDGVGKRRKSSSTKLRHNVIPYRNFSFREVKTSIHKSKSGINLKRHESLSHNHICFIFFQNRNGRYSKRQWERQVNIKLVTFF